MTLVTEIGSRKLLATRASLCVGLLVTVLAAVGCTTKNMEQVNRANMFSPEEIQRLGRVKVFFGHKSVGDNILQGVRDLEADHATLSLKVVSSNEPASVKGPALVEASLGENRNPESKNKAFAA